MTTEHKYERYNCKRCGKQDDYFQTVVRVFKEEGHPGPLFLDDYPTEWWCLGCVMAEGADSNGRRADDFRSQFGHSILDATDEELRKFTET
jgi:hypothetical protein